MANPYFQFKQFTVQQDRCAMKVTTDGCLFGAWCADKIQRIRQLKRASVLDIGAGTGLLSLMLAQKTAASIEAVELDPAAAEQAKENVVSSRWSKRITVTQADVMRWQPPHKFDFIVSNPPFYENDLRSGTTAKNLAHHDEGLKLGDLFTFIKTHLKQDGLFFLLLPAKRTAVVEKSVAGNGLALHEKTVVKQTPEHTSFRVMIKGGKKKEEVTEAAIIIKNHDGRYTPEFTALLNDYYLYL